MSKAGLGTHLEAIICCLGGRGSRLQWGVDRALFLGSEALSMTYPTISNGPARPFSYQGPHQGKLSRSGSINAYTPVEDSQ